MTKIWYFLTTFAESGLSVFGLRGPYEQPAYQVVQQISPSIEIRHYAPGMAVEAAMTPGNEGEAFGKLFRYITGANKGNQMISMTAPVAEGPAMIAMTVPVVTSGSAGTMRFFLPASVVSHGAPVPTDPDVHLVVVPAATLGVIRYTGVVSQKSQAGKPPTGAPIYLSYDPPFTIPFLRRNEVAIPVS
jgi:hypothetical protein